MSTMRRIYVPLHTTQLEELRDSRELGGDRLVAYAATAGTESSGQNGEDVELQEYAAMQEAAVAALSDEAVVVAAADVAPSVVEASANDSQINVIGPLPLKRFASFHLIDRDTYDAESTDGVELSWFDATELDLLLSVIAHQ